MDFKRIQFLLLVFFVIFDLFLAYLLVERGAFGLKFQDPTAQVNPIQEMQDRGVKVRSGVQLTGKMSPLAIIKSTPNTELWSQRQQLENQTVSIDSTGVLTSDFTNPIPLQTSLQKDNRSLTSTDFAWIYEHVLKDPTLFIHGDQYLNHWYSPQDRVIIIRMVTKEGNLNDLTDDIGPVPISDGSAEIRILLDENYNMVSYKQTYQESFMRLEQEKALISAYDAIESIENRIDTTLPNDAEIISMTPGYYQSVQTEEFNLYTPAWELIYYRKESGQSVSVIVDAIKGNVVSSKPKK